MLTMPLRPVLKTVHGDAQLLLKVAHDNIKTNVLYMYDMHVPSIAFPGNVCYLEQTFVGSYQPL